MNEFMKLNFDFLKFSAPVYIQIIGRSLIQAEGYCRIEDYSETKILLSSSEGVLAVCGDKLTLKYLSDERVSIEGRIEKIEFI